MALPPRTYFHLYDVAEAWGSSVPELASYVMDGSLNISVMVICKRVEIGSYEDDSGSWHRVPRDYAVLNGPQPVWAEDLWPVFQQGAGEITRFKPSAGDDYVDLRDDVAPIKIVLNDLLVTRAERQRFEQQYGLSTNEPTAEDLAFTHSDNYQEVSLNGRRFELGPAQAAVVRQLHERSKTSHPWMNGKDLLRAAKARSTRLVDLFKSKPDWKELILADGKGNYQLKLRDQHSEESSTRAYRRFRPAFASSAASHLA
jgi:hypothetical protein